MCTGLMISAENAPLIRKET